MYLGNSAAARSILQPQRVGGAMGLGALAANLNEYVLPSGALSTPGQGGSIRSTYKGPLPSQVPYLPVYGTLPKAPKGSQGKVDFPYTINPPSFTGNFYWWTGGAVMSVGYPQYSNDCWEFLRAAMVDSDFGSVGKWLAWATTSFGWSVTDIQNFNFAAYRWTAIQNTGQPLGPLWRTPTYGAPVAAPTVAASPVASGGGGTSAIRSMNLLGLGSVRVWGPPYASMPTYPLWWSLADIQNFYNQLEQYAGPQSQCLPALLKNWNQAWTNYSKSPTGPIIPVLQLSSCPPGDSFWKGFALYVASVAAIYGIALAATAAVTSGATSAATGVSAEAASDAVPAAIEVASPEVEAATVTGTTASAAADTLAEVTVTASAAPATLAPAAAASLTAATAADLAASVANPTLDTSEPDANVSQPSTAPAASPTSALTQASQLTSLAKGVTSLLAASPSGAAVASPYPPGTTFDANGNPILPGTGFLNGSTLGIPNVVWLLAAGLGLVVATRS